MTHISFTESHVSQIPAMQALVAMGYIPLSQASALTERGNNLRSVLLEDILTQKILELNSFERGNTTHHFTEPDAREAIRKLKSLTTEPKGLMQLNQDIYNELLLGTTITKNIGGDSKSQTIKFIDWHNPANNAYHFAAEFPVETLSQHYGAPATRRPDIVLFVNGIPLGIIENKAAHESVTQGISQLIGYQGSDEIPHLFHYSQLLISTNKNEVKYGTVGTPLKFWHIWREEQDKDKTIQELINRPLTESPKEAIFSGDFLSARSSFGAEAARLITEQDRVLHALCRPERLIELVHNFCIFDKGVKKLPRHQQFFGVVESMTRIRQFRSQNIRRGGLVWHTQGSGKSLTMVMLAKALNRAADIKNARIIIVTDRNDLDEQIKNTFISCGIEGKELQAASSNHLIELLAQKKSLITTIINKFETATSNVDFRDEDCNIFVLVDESHRTQYGSLSAKMRHILPNACYIGFTGTPLLKVEKNTIESFEGLIHKYGIDEAVRDGAVVPLFYEARSVELKLAGTAIDQWFDRLSEGLEEKQKAVLKKRFSTMSKLSGVRQLIYATALDISEHYTKTWQGTGRKAQLVAPTKAAAIKFKQELDNIGDVTSAVIISPSDDREGNEEVDVESKDGVRAFWDDMMKQYGSEEEYNRKITDDFKASGDLEILIVVSKLLTGFDAPRNTVLYICKPLKEHNLLQAIARVNRLFEEGGDSKDKGYIIDYEGLGGELSKSTLQYSAFAGYDEEDVAGSLYDIREELRQLGVAHQNIWDIFNGVSRRDHEEMEMHLGDEAVREEFYVQLRELLKLVQVASSSEKTYEILSKEEFDRIKSDCRELRKLKVSVGKRYQDSLDFTPYEIKMQKLLDDHISATPAQVIIEQFNIHDHAALASLMKDDGLTDGYKADQIAAATKKTIIEHMAENRALYQALSELLEEAIRDYRNKKIDGKTYLSRADSVRKDVELGRRHKNDVPEKIQDNLDAQAFYGELLPFLKDNQEIAAEVALESLRIIKEGCHKIVNVWINDKKKNDIRDELDDLFFGGLNKMGIKLSTDNIVEIYDKLFELAKNRRLDQ